MRGSRLISFGRVMALAGALILAGGGMVRAQEAVAVVADSPVTTFWQGIMQTLTNAKNIADEAWQKLSLAQQVNTTLTTGAGNAIGVVNGMAAYQTAVAVGSSTNDTIYHSAYDPAIAKTAIDNNPQNNIVALCSQATLAAGLGNAAIQVATILTPKPWTGTKITSVRQQVGAAGGTPSTRHLPTDPDLTHNTTQSVPQEVTEAANDIKAFFCEKGTLGGDCNNTNTALAHADTEPVNFFRDRTFTDIDELGFDQFEKYVCGLVPENTPMSANYHGTAPGATQLVNQEADIAHRALCLQAYNEFYSNHLPVVDANTNAAIAAIYNKVTSSTTGTAISTIANTSTMSREDLLHALYQGIAEGQDSATNIFTQIAGLEALPTLKMIAAELIINNYMQYDLHEKQTEANMYLSIIAKQSMGSGLH